ncbi:MAG: cell division transport system ATP-binding [Prolixibacteraceae bacterium]|nr:MAG: cell division transport system ATP-binding [Prolixibacteraceae bacterium]
MGQKKIVELVNADIYQRENLILSNVNLEINSGEFIYVIGKVGTGKSSLIKILNAEIPLISGIGTVVGHRLNGMKQREVAGLRRKLGVVFQDFRLLTDRNVHDNLAFVLKATGWKNKIEIESRIAEVLESVGALNKLMKMPHQLSGGEQQRVVIGRAILNSPELILADEPTGNLDPETSEQILDLFINLNEQGRTVIMVTHDYASIAKKPTRTLVCANGRISDSEANNTTVDFQSLLERNW